MAFCKALPVCSLILLQTSVAFARTGHTTGRCATGTTVTKISAYFPPALWYKNHAFGRDSIHTASGHVTTADTLNEVSIRGIKPGRQTSVTPVQTLSGARLERLNSLSVADALRYFSGVQVKDYGGIGGLKTINVRSMGTAHTAVFYDGVQLDNAQNGQTDLGRFSMENMDEIDLYNAQNTTIFQPARAFSASSALYLRSKEPVFSEGESDHIKGTFSTGSFGLISPSVLWQHKISRAIYSTLSGGWQHANGRYRFRYTNSVYDTTAVRQNGDIDAFRIEGSLYGGLADSSRWSLKIFSYSSERGLPRAVVSNNFESHDRQSDAGTFLQGNWQNRQSKRLRLMFSGKYAYDYMRYLRPDYDNIEGRLDNRYRQQEIYFSGSGLYHLLSGLDLAASSDLVVNNLTSGAGYFPHPVRYTKLFSLAGEFHKEQVTVQANILGTFVKETVKKYTAPPDRRKISPALSVSWQPAGNGNVMLRAFYKDIFRMPTFNDLYYTYPGNTSLRPESARQYDAGITLRKTFSSGFWQDLSFSSDAYYNQVRDKIVAVPGENIASWIMMNIGKAEIKGAEMNFEATAKTGNSLVLNAVMNYTFQQSLDVTDPADYNYRQQLPYTPKHSGSLTCGAAWKDVWLSYSYIYTGERYSQKANTPENYMEPWYTHDVALSVRQAKGRLSYKATAGISNLLNQYRDVVLNFPMPGRSYRISLSVDY